jgi:glycerol kinase
MTGGKLHMTDYATASRTMLLNIHEGKWDKDILNKLEIPEKMLPVINSSSMLYGYTDPECFWVAKLPLQAT